MRLISVPVLGPRVVELIAFRADERLSPAQSLIDSLRNPSQTKEWRPGRSCAFLRDPGVQPDPAPGARLPGDLSGESSPGYGTAGRTVAGIGGVGGVRARVVSPAEEELCGRDLNVPG